MFWGVCYRAICLGYMASGSFSMTCNSELDSILGDKRRNIDKILNFYRNLICRKRKKMHNLRLYSKVATDNLQAPVATTTSNWIEGRKSSAFFLLVFQYFIFP